MLDGPIDKTQSAKDTTPAELRDAAYSGMAESLKQMGKMLEGMEKIEGALPGTKLGLKASKDGGTAQTPADKRTKVASDSEKPAETKEIEGKQYRILKDSNFMDIPLTRDGVTVTQVGSPESKTFKFDCKLDQASCQPQPDGRFIKSSVLKAETLCAANVKISVGADGQPEKIVFTNFENVKGDAVIAGVLSPNTKIVEARFIKQKNGTIDGKYDIETSIPRMAKNWKIDTPPSGESFNQLAGQLALRMKENGLLNDGKHPELRRLADAAEAAELAQNQRVSPNKATGS